MSPQSKRPLPKVPNATLVRFEYNGTSLDRLAEVSYATRGR